MIRKLRESQEKCRAEWRKVATSVFEAPTLAIELLDSVGAHMCTTEHATYVNCWGKLGIEAETVTDGQDKSCEAFAMLR